LLDNRKPNFLFCEIQATRGFVKIDAGISLKRNRNVSPADIQNGGRYGFTFSAFTILGESGLLSYFH